MRLLVVDDDPAIRTWLCTVFSPHAECHVAADGNEAVTAVRQTLEEGRPYDLITLDIMMPGIDGHQTLAKIRQLEKEHERRGANVIMTTAMEDPRHCVRSFRAGCEAYVTKPLNREEILDQARRLLGGLPDISNQETKSAAVQGVGPSAENHQSFLGGHKP